MQAFIDSFNLPVLTNPKEKFQRLLLSYNDICIPYKIIDLFFPEDQYNNKKYNVIYIDHISYIIVDLGKSYIKDNKTFKYEEYEPKINIIKDNETFEILLTLANELETIRKTNLFTPIYNKKTRRYEISKNTSEELSDDIFNIERIKEKIKSDRAIVASDNNKRDKQSLNLINKSEVSFFSKINNKFTFSTKEDITNLEEVISLNEDIINVEEDIIASLNRIRERKDQLIELRKKLSQLKQ